MLINVPVKTTFLPLNTKCLANTRSTLQNNILLVFQKRSKGIKTLIGHIDFCQEIILGICFTMLLILSYS